MVALEDACGRCDSALRGTSAIQRDNAEEEVLQTIPDVLMLRFAWARPSLRQLARHLVKGDTVYEKYKRRTEIAYVKAPIPSEVYHLTKKANLESILMTAQSGALMIRNAGSVKALQK
ncbi:MAG: hypothetical protein ACLU3I_04170 [Acutalibacteraceae bacterium]